MSGLVLMIAGRPVSDIHVLRYDMDKYLIWIFIWIAVTKWFDGYTVVCDIGYHSVNGT